MNRYDSYKPSGVEWLGEIPTHWRRNRIKFILSRAFSGVWGGDPLENEDDIVCYRVSDFDYNHGILNHSNLTLRNIQRRHLAGKLVSMGDLLIEKSGGGEVTPVGRVVRVNIADRATCSNFVYSISVKPEYSSNFLYYYFHQLYSKRVNLLFFNQTTGIQNLQIDGYLSQILYLPPLSEQVRIAEYLDEKCTEIDGIIRREERSITLLDELKQSIISEAVTRGLDPTTPLKPSGTEWIGEIPSHWEVQRLRFLCEFRNGYTPSKSAKQYWEDGTIPWYRMEDIRETGRKLSEAKQYVTEEAVKGNGLFSAESFILATTATIGEHALLIADSLANQRFTNLKIRESLTGKLTVEFFFYYLFLIDEYCKSTTKAATFPAVDMTDLKNVLVTLPPLSEQVQIAEYLDEKCAEIDQAEQSKQRKIELLTELKQSLISDVVTGRIKVI